MDDFYDGILIKNFFFYKKDMNSERTTKFTPGELVWCPMNTEGWRPPTTHAFRYPSAHFS